MRRRGILALAGALAATGAAAAKTEKAEKERAEPPPPPAPVTIGAVRYEAPHWTHALGLPHNGGWVIAYDSSSGARLWSVQVYGLAGPESMEQDKREVFIVELRADPNRRHLQLADERGRRWRLDLQTRAVSPVHPKPSGR